MKEYICFAAFVKHNNLQKTYCNPKQKRKDKDS